MSSFKKESLKINLLVIGAQKSGTTSLHNYLHELKDIHMSQPIKEPGFFLPFNVTKSYYENKSIKLKDPFHLLNKYMLRGYGGEKIIGESSTFYSNDEFNHNGLARRIYDYNPKMKLIYLIRNPLDRIISHFQHELHQRSISQDINMFISNRKDVLGISNYKKQLMSYMPIFSKENIMVLLFEDMVSAAWDDNNLLKFLNLNTSSTNRLDHYNISQNPSLKKLLIDSINKENNHRIDNLKMLQKEYFSKEFNVDFTCWSKV